jgi:protein disulfide-isomerase A6
MATNLVGQLKVGKVNCVEHRQLCDKYAVKGYPSIKFFAPGEKTEDKIIDYGDGSRSSGVLENWALEKKILYEPAKFDQLITEEIFKSYCREAKGICLIAFLPHIYDTTKEDRNAYLDVLREVS